MKHFWGITLLFILSSNAFSLEYQGITALDLDKLLAETKSKESSVISDEPGLIRIDIQQGASVYFFTKEGHFAHPSVVIRNVTESKNRVYIKTTGYTAGDRKVFEGWLKQFEAQDKAIQKKINQQ